MTMTVQTHLIATTTSYAVFAYLYRKGINIPVIGTNRLTIYPLLFCKYSRRRIKWTWGIY